MTKTANATHRFARLLPLLLLGPLTLGTGGCDGAVSDSAPGEPTEQGLVILNPGEDPRDYFHDFGTIPYGEKRTHTLRLKNSDPRPVVIQDLQSSCSCSIGRISYVDEAGREVLGNRRKDPVIVLPPGVEADLTFEIDTTAVRLANADKLAQVRLRCDSPNKPFVTFEMHLKVDLAFQATPKTINLGRVPISTGARGRSDLITGLPGGLQRVTGVIESSPRLEVGIRQEEKPGGTLWIVDAVLTPPLERGLWKGKIILSATGDDGTGEGRPFEIPVLGNVVDDIIVRPPTLAFTRFSPVDGSTGTAELVALAPGHRTLVTGARLEGELPEGVEVGYEPKKADATGRSASWTITVTVPPSVEAERFVGKVILELDDTVQERVEAGMIFNP